MEYRKKIHNLLRTEGCIKIGENYRFGRKTPIGRLKSLTYLNEKVFIPEDMVEEALVYLDEELERIEKERTADSGKPTMEEWKDGDPFPEFCTAYEMAMLLFSTLKVTTSGNFAYDEKRGVPIWMKHINSSLVPTDRVKEHDLRAGLAEEKRRQNSQKTEEEKERGPKITVDDILVFRHSVMDVIRKQERDRIIGLLKYDKSVRVKGMKELALFVKKYMAPKKSDHSDKMHTLHVCMIAHWIWQVKRKLNGRATVYEIALIFLGRQGIGKSYSTNRITSVVEGLSTPASVSNVVDDRETRRWENYYIAFMDEISKEKKESLAKLKDWITKKEAEFRPLYANSSEICEKNAQAIGTTNFPLNSILKDPTGMRRFWEIPSDQKQNVLFDGMEKIDFTLIWKAVDENSDVGYYGPESIGKDFYKEIVDIQNSSRDKSPVEEYLCLHNYVNLQGFVNPDKNKKWFSVDDIKIEFNAWASQNGWGEYTPKAVRMELGTLHLEMKRGTSNKMMVEMNIPEDMQPENELTEQEELGFGNE